MLRIRKTDGSVLDVEDGAFVEWCDPDGNPARVYYRGTNGEFRIIDASSRTFRENYERLYGVTFLDQVIEKRL